MQRKMRDIPVCDPDKHKWQKEYYGYRCTVCGEILDFNSEVGTLMDSDDQEVFYEDDESE